MIIKSMARKQPSFGQLIAYLDRDANGNSNAMLTHNLYGHALSSQAIEAEFLSNHSHLPKRKNGNALFHEVLVLEQNPNLSKSRQAEILKTLANEYLAKRAPDQLAFGRVHHNTDHAHIHLMISSNAVRSSRRKRLSKARFAEIQREIEQLALARFPELEDQLVYGRGHKHNQRKSTEREVQHKLRAGKPNQKDQVRFHFQQSLKKAANEAELNQFLKSDDLKLYRRGNQTGLESGITGKRYRLKTLGLQQSFEDWQRGLSVQSKVKNKTNEQNHNDGHFDDRAAKLLESRSQAERFAERHLDDDWSRS